VFSYGVVVFWNFTERQEKDILADLTFAGNSPPPSRDGPRHSPTSSRHSPILSRTMSPPEAVSLLSHENDDDDEPSQLQSAMTPGSFSSSGTHDTNRATRLMVRPLKEIDVQIEDFHFEYNPRTRSPRIRDDMITYVVSSSGLILGFVLPLQR